MKIKTLVLSAVALGMATIASNPVFALDLSGKTYFMADAGPSLMQNLTIKDADGHKAKFSVGSRADVGVGYRLTDSVAMELETGLIWNHIRAVGVEGGGGGGGGVGGNPYLNGKGDIYEVPIMANGVFNFPLKGAFKSFVGVGAGGVATLMEARFPSSPVNDTDFTFAYQVFTGVKYSLSDRVSVGAAYKFMGTLDHDWRGSSLIVRSEGLYSHSFLAMLSVSF